ncbi:hypothetical protein QVD17_10349 [Tagetes erecta]|uniref:Receptor-like serine/threonine-protein kinase n=1 Tax=Tagetes erecta TaxID=13708 RepID=A0AAD8L0W6_TARER|nr:hypothetical protein QVD17_10349 [Tagetes erecta]
MASLFVFFHLLLLLSKTPVLSSSPTFVSQPSVLKPGSSLSVENKDDFLISPNGLFTAGFYAVGENAYCFSVWFTKPLRDKSHTIVWMANRDVPVNGKRSKLSLLKTGNLVLRDASQPLPIWTTNIINSKEPAQLIMNNTGNLYLQNQDNQTIWQSFGSPTDTLLTLQNLTKDTPLVSSRSLTNYSSGVYRLYFDSDNVIRLAYNTPTVAGTYWPDPMLTAWASGRSTWVSRRIANMDLFGRFVSSDSLFFNTSDAENQFVIRRLTVDVDGNFRAYSLDETRGIWKVTWQAISDACKVHGICGDNSTCSVVPGSGRKCSCIPNHTMINQTDWSLGCKPKFNTTLCGNNEDTFLRFPHFDFYGYDAAYVANATLDECKKVCLGICHCKGFYLKYQPGGFYSCYAKFRLLNGYKNSNGSMYLKVPKSFLLSPTSKDFVYGDSLNCSKKLPTVPIERAYEKNPKNESLKSLMIFTYVFGALETICIIYFLYKTRGPSTARKGYLQAATGFQRFSYAELKRATNNFSKEIGRGGGGIVYKGEFSDNRVAAVKLLKEYSNKEGEAELLAEISTLGRLNHMNLIDIWGYCAERKHKLLVYEYLENGSLAQNLHSSKLDWGKRFNIALGTAKGLAYLHEECLEWVLHCDVKPHNILLDSDFNPKVADFGLSKLLKRDGSRNSEFTRARGTRGYMAPEWLFVNHPITSKVDVYSYGVVMLEMITGRSPAGDQNAESKGRLDSWVKEKMMEAGGTNEWIKEVVDVTVDGNYDTSKMDILIKVALLCSQEDKDARPTMRQVMDMLLQVEEDSDNYENCI